jgi:glutamyl-tRNA reductase
VEIYLSGWNISPYIRSSFVPVLIMRIYCVGINHRTAPIHLRERLTFDDPAVCAGLTRLGTRASGRVTEAVLLSTCNPVEVYAAATEKAFAAL